MTGKYAVPSSSNDPAYYVQLEGNFPDNAATRVGSYDVPYRMMIPRRAGTIGGSPNLLVPVALSASHAAFASTRIEAMLMSTGTAAGVAAVQAIKASTCVQDVDVGRLQETLAGTFNQTIHVE